MSVRTMPAFAADASSLVEQVRIVPAQPGQFSAVGAGQGAVFADCGKRAIRVFKQPLKMGLDQRAQPISRMFVVLDRTVDVSAQLSPT
jgi:hypothetical protein